MAMDEVTRCDAREAAADPTIPWGAYEGSAVVVTGATGLIGRALVAAFAARERLTPSGMRVTCLVRDVDRAKEELGDESCLAYIEWHAECPDVSETDVLSADWVFHCAGMTGSSDFLERPVEVIETTVGGARAMLALADRTDAGLCLLSTMEVYGEATRDGPLGEGDLGLLDPMLPRSSYPEAKRLAEALCAAHASELGTRAVALRLCQTMGPGVRRDDRRAFAEFARCALGGKDIVLLTGGSKRSQYLYTADAARAALFAAALGESGCAYNAANDIAFCSVREMAEMVAGWLGGGRSRVRVELDAEAARRFRGGSVLRLDTSRLEALGWCPTVGLEEMYERMVEGWRC